MLEIFSVVSSVLPSLGSVLGNALKVGIQVLNAVSKGLTAFGNALGLFETDDPEKLGTKRILAEEEGIEPENYDTYDEYLKAVDEFEIDEERAAEIPTEDKLVKAAQHAVEAIDYKYPEANVVEVAEGMVANPEFYEDDRFAGLAELVGNNPEKLAVIGKLLNGELEGDEFYDAIDMIVSAEQTKHPELSSEEIKERVQNALA
ncbi:MAG: hypothetical protein PUF06_03495 [Veillonellaceae bacterium]|nr:hypothetical protein [Veillonellaceae bacterium]